MAKKELHSEDLADLGLSRGSAYFSDDALKQARAIREHAKEVGRDIVIGRNKRTGEINLFENGQNLGTLNRKGISRADIENLIKDPTNLAFFIPGIGAGVGGALKAARAGTKLAKATALSKYGAKLGGATAALDLANSAQANLQGNSKALDAEDVSRAATIGALAPFADILGQKIGQVAKGLKNSNTKKVNLNTHNVKLTPGQATGNENYLQLEEKARRGLLGTGAKNDIDNFESEQINNYKDNLSKGLKVTFDDEGVNRRLADSIINKGIEDKKHSKELVRESYGNLNLAKIGVTKRGLQNIIEDMKQALSNDNSGLSYEEIAEHVNNNQDSPYRTAVKEIEKMHKALLGGKAEEAATFNIGQDVSNASFIYGSSKPKVTHNLEKNALDKLNKGDYEVLSNGNYKVSLGEGKQALIDKREPNKIYITDVIAKDTNKDGQPFGSGKRHRDDFIKEMLEGTAQSVPQEAFKDYREIELAKRMLNQTMDKAGKLEDSDTLRQLNNLHKSFLNSEEQMLNTGNHLVGDKKELEKLIDARAKNTDYESKFRNKEVKGETQETVKSTGARAVLDLIEDPSKTGENLVNIFKGDNTALKLATLSKIREIFGNTQDEHIKQIVLNNLFTDIGKNVGRGDISLNQTVKGAAANKINNQISKNNAFAEELFTKEELAAISKEKDTLEKLSRSSKSVNPSGTAVALMREGLGKIPLLKQAYDHYLGEIFNRWRIQRHLNKNTAKVGKGQVNSTPSKAGSAIGAFINSLNREANN